MMLGHQSLGDECFKVLGVDRKVCPELTRSDRTAAWDAALSTYVPPDLSLRIARGFIRSVTRRVNAVKEPDLAPRVAAVTPCKSATASPNRWARWCTSASGCVVQKGPRDRKSSSLTRGSRYQTRLELDENGMAFTSGRDETQVRSPPSKRGDLGRDGRGIHQIVKLVGVGLQIEQPLPTASVIRLTQQHVLH